MTPGDAAALYPRPSRYKWVSILLALALLILLRGSPLRAAPVALGVDLATVSESRPLLKQLSLLEDKTGQRSLQAAMAAANWQPVSASSLNRGYTASTIWLRGTLYNDSTISVTRWLAVGTARLEVVNYFRFAPGQNTPQETVLSGNSRPLKQRPIIAAIPVFPITLAPGEHLEFVLEIHSRSAVEMIPTLWEPAEFRQHEGRELVTQAFLLGLPLVLALYALIQGLSWRDRSFLLLPLWIVLALAYNLAFQGYLYRYILTSGGEWILRAPSTLGTIASVAYAVVTLLCVDLNRIRLWRWCYGTLIGLMLLGCAWTAFGDYRSGAIFSNEVVALFYLLWVLSTVDAWRRGLPNGRLFVLSFSAVWMIFLVALLNLHGYLHQAWLADLQMSWLVELGLLLMMTVIVTNRSLEMVGAHSAMQQALLETQVLEQLRLEQAVVERTHELRTALIAADEANHAKTDFLTRISHDLRTPLTSIIGFADLVQAAGRDNAERGRIIGRSASHMLAMVNDLIDYARGGDPDALQIAPVYLHALLASMAQEGAELAGRRGNRFEFKIQGPLPPILQLDAKRLRRMLSNLLDNAAKYTHDGLIELLVECNSSALPDYAVELIIQVKDNGCGIAPEDQQRIFEPFERLDTARALPGIGLGLAIVSQWITRMDGSLHIDSTPGAGTTIGMRLVTLAASEDMMARHHVSDTSATLPTIDGNGLCIWIAEDTADIRQLLTDELSSLGFTVETAVDGLAIIERMLRADQPRPDLLLTDYLMPNADGSAVLNAAREYLPGVPVVVLSATPHTHGNLNANEPSGFDASLLKPVNFAELQDTLARLLNLSTIPQLGNVLEAPPLVWPPQASLTTAHHLIDLGAISDLIDWVNTLVLDHPQCEFFAHQARQLISRGDLAGLQKLCLHESSAPLPGGSN